MYEIYTNYEGQEPNELEVTFETWAEVVAWCEEFDSTATCEEDYQVYSYGERVYFL